MSILKAANVVPSTVAAVGVAVTYLAYAPGLVPPDARDQFSQAQTGRFVDTHPPIMAWLWSKMILVIPGPEGFFLLLIALYWAGFFLLIRHLLGSSRIRAAIASVLPFSPILFNFVGTIWKDVLVFGCLLVASGIILCRPSDRATRFPPMPTLVVLILFLLASLARWNSVVAVVPLAVLAIWPIPPAHAPLRRTIYRLVLCSPIALLIWATSGKLLDVTVIHAKQTGFANVWPFWDLMGMSHHLGENLLPGTWSEHESEEIIGPCYNAGNANDLADPRTPCIFIRQDLVKNGYWQTSVLFPLWAKTVLSHPGAYFHFRLDYVHTLFWPNEIFVFDADDGAPFNDHYGLLYQVEKRMLRYCRTAPLLHFPFTVGFWMIAAAILTAGFAIAVMRGRTGCYPSLMLALSGGANLWPFVIVGADGQLRFAYWTIAASSIALLIARSDMAKVEPAFAIVQQ